VKGISEVVENNVVNERNTEIELEKE